MQRPSGSACVLLVCITASAVIVPATVSAQTSSPESSNHYTPISQREGLETAETMMQRGDTDAAEVVYRHVFESLRADQGLYHEAQLPVLDRLLAANLARQDWEQFNHYLDYHRALTDRIYQNQAGRLAEALETGADWHQRAALVMADEHRTWHLIRARNLIWRAVSALEQTPGNQPRVSPLLYRIVTLHYYLTTEASLRGLTSLEVRSDRPLRLAGWSMSGNEAARRSYAIGQELLERIYQLHAAADNNAHDLAHIDTLLGDWQLLFGRDTLAREYYLKAYHLLRPDPAAAPLIEQLFGSAVILPAPYFSTPSGSNTLLSAMKLSRGLARPQLTDDFFTEDHQYELDQTSR